MARSWVRSKARSTMETWRVFSRRLLRAPAANSQLPHADVNIIKLVSRGFKWLRPTANAFVRPVDTGRLPHCDEPHNPAPINRSSHGPAIKVMAMSVMGLYRRVRETVFDLRQHKGSMQCTVNGSMD